VTGATVSQPRLVVVGVSHTRTPAHLRERAYVSPDEAEALARTLAAEDREAVVLATCNRTELYLADTDVPRAVARARLAFASRGGGVLSSMLFVSTGIGAAEHLFRVAAGLDSIVVGDSDVLAQVRGAHERARAAGATAALLDRLFESALATGKRVRSETSITEAPASIPAAAADLAARVAGPLDDRRVLVIGAGRMARRAALNLRSRGCTEIVVANRTLSRARQLAERVGGHAAGLDELGRELDRVDIVVAATGARGFVLSSAHARAAAAGRGSRPLLILDLGLPRDVDPSFRELRSCRLFNVDDLGKVVAATTAQRSAEAQRADEIVTEELERFRTWERSRAVVPAIVSLRRRGEEIRRAELARREGELAQLGPRERTLIETLTAQIVAKLLHEPTLELKRAADRSDASRYAEVVEQLFRLDREKRAA
jgi:glutamyl-tRNA reductase